MKYCEDARKLLGIEVVCGKECPIVKNCPRLIMEDATDKAIEEAIEALIKLKGLSK